MIVYAMLVASIVEVAFSYILLIALGLLNGFEVQYARNTDEEKAGDAYKRGQIDAVRQERRSNDCFTAHAKALLASNSSEETVRCLSE